MHRFFLTPEHTQGDTVHFPPDIAHQITRVLRLHEGEQVTVLDNLGNQMEVALFNLASRDVSGKIVTRSTACGEPACRLSLYLCLSQREKFEWILQKCTEIGAASFTPVISERSLVQDEKTVLNKLDRWKQIIREAAEQSGRGQLPLLNQALSFESALRTVRQARTLAIMPWEKEHTLSLRTVLMQNKNQEAVVVFIGPEGGFSEKEVELARQAGFQTVTLGARILRMETAAIAAAAIILYEISHS